MKLLQDCTIKESNTPFLNTHWKLLNEMLSTNILSNLALVGLFSNRAGLQIRGHNFFFTSFSTKSCCGWSLNRLNEIILLRTKNMFTDGYEDNYN